MNRADIRRLQKLKVTDERWEVGRLSVAVAEQELHAVAVVRASDGLALRFEPGDDASLLEHVVAAMQHPESPARPGRPRTVVCRTAAEADELSPITKLCVVGHGPTPMLDRLAGLAALTSDEMPGRPTVRLPEWEELHVSLVTANPFEALPDGFEAVFEGGALDGALLVVGDPSEMLLFDSEEDFLEAAETGGPPEVEVLGYTLVPADELPPEAKADPANAGLVHGDTIGLVARMSGLILTKATDEDQERFLDALLAARTVAREHAQALTEGEVVSVQVAVGDRAYTVTAEIGASDDPEELEGLVSGEHWVTTFEAEQDGATMIAVEVKGRAEDVRAAARALGELERILVVPDEGSGDIVLIACTAHDAIGVICSVPPEQGASIVGERVLLTLAQGGVASGVVRERDILFERVVALSRPS